MVAIFSATHFFVKANLLKTSYTKKKKETAQ